MLLFWKYFYHMYTNPPPCGRHLLSILTAIICTGNEVLTWYITSNGTLVLLHVTEHKKWIHCSINGIQVSTAAVINMWKLIAIKNKSQMKTMRICIHIQHDRKIYNDWQKLSPDRFKWHCEMPSPAKDLVFSWYEFKQMCITPVSLTKGKQPRRVVFSYLYHDLLIKLNRRRIWGLFFRANSCFRYRQS